MEEKIATSGYVQVEGEQGGNEPVADVTSTTVTADAKEWTPARKQIRGAMKQRKQVLSHHGQKANDALMKKKARAKKKAHRKMSQFA